MLKQFECSYCHCHNGKILAEADDIRFRCFGFDKKIVCCLKCSLVQLFPIWSYDDVGTLYNKYNTKKSFKGQRDRKNIRVKDVEKYIPCKDSRVLEIGCGKGHTLNYLRGKGYKNLFGIDKDKTVCNGEDILNIDIEDTNFSEKFDFIYAFYLYEHIINPIKFIQGVLTNLSSGGRFLFLVPNVNDPLVSVYHNIEFARFRWYPYHVFFYDKNTVKCFFEQQKISVKVVLQQEYGLLNHIRWMMLKRPGNFNIKIPLVDKMYAFFLTKILGESDNILVIGEQNQINI